MLKRDELLFIVWFPALLWVAAGITIGLLVWLF